jgi:RNA-dependent RNA polymerase
MIMELRQKQRILVNKSACLIGVLDETGTLEYGQTYIRIKHSDQVENEVDETIDGFVAVTKNPCFHPGDVRKLTAIKAPQLSHHINVIVFPSKGPRPHPNEISGSDLDGDLYFVTWESGLVRFESVESMDFSVSRKAEEVDEMNSEMMKTFFLKFICSDNLGIIANAHLAIADDSPQKANDERCLKLAKMHSTAVDFAKTGVSDVIPKELKPKRYPDFMENKTKEQYGSTKVIGVLYRQAKDFKYQLEDFVSEELQEPYPDLRTAVDDLYQLYQSELQGVMNIFNIQTEVEVLTGEVAKYSKFYNNNQKKRREETRTKLKNIVEKLTKGMTDRFLEKATDRIMDLALECRYIAYTDPTHKYPGFPWVIAHTHLLRS